MEKALQRLSKLLGRHTAQDLRARFERVAEMRGANRLLKRVASSSDDDQLRDYLAEIRYALVFAGLGFQVDVEPEGKKGPDLGISRDSHYAVVEVMRFRKVYPGPPVLDLTGELGVLPEYGDPSRDIQKSFGKILDKFRQVKKGESIIAIWNDDEDLEEVEVQAATAHLRAAAAHGTQTFPSGLLFVLYGSKWVGANSRQLYCFSIQHPAQGHQQIWHRELESSTVEELVWQALTHTHGAT